MTWETLRRRIRQGRGQGWWDDYLPWLWVQRKNPSPLSNQVVKRLPGYRRGAHFYSGTEWVIALLCRWLGRGRVDAREQFPLWPMPHPHPLVEGVPNWRDPTVKGLMEIADQAGIRHGVAPGSNCVPYVATLDLMLTHGVGGERSLSGLSIKPHDLVTRAEPTDRLLERHELERRYMKEVGGRIAIVDASIVDHTIRGNLEMLATYHGTTVPDTAQAEDFFAAMGRAEDANLMIALRLAAKHVSIPYPTAFQWFYAAVWHRRIDVDISRPLLGACPVPYGGKALTDALSAEVFGEVV